MIHWTIPFTGIDGSSYAINIYDSSYSGSAVKLTGSAEPFEYSEDNSDDFFSPICGQSGYIRIKKDASWSDSILPVSARDRKVEVTRNGVLYWRGYIKPEIFSQTWEGNPTEIELPVQSQISLIVSDKSQGHEERTDVFEILAGDIFRMAEYSYVVFPYDWSAGDLYPLRTLVNTQQRLDDDGLMENESFISDFLNFWSLRLREKGDTLYFMGRHGCTYRKWSWSDFWQDRSPLDEFYYGSISLRNHIIAGNRNRLSLLPPVRSFTVEAVCGSDRTTIKGIDREKMIYSGTTDTVSGSFPAGDRLRRMFYKPGGGARVDFFSWNNTKSKYGEENNWVQETYSATHTRGGVTASAGWLRCDCYKNSDISNGTKKAYSYTDIIRLWHNISSFEEQSGDIDYNDPTDSESLELPLARITFSDLFYAQSGAICLTGSLLYQGVSATRYLSVILRCGNSYYNGKSWVSTKSFFDVQIVDDKIKSNKTINDLYEDATDGLLIPINVTLYGKLTLTIVANRGYNMYLSGFTLKYCPVETASLAKKTDDRVKYGATIVSQADEDVEQEIGMASYTDSAYDLGTVMKPDGKPLTVIYPNYSSSGSIRPEQGILSLAKTELQQPRQKIEVTLRHFDIMPIQQVSYGGKVYNINSISAKPWDGEMTLRLIETRVMLQTVEYDFTTRAEIEQCVSMAAKSLFGASADITLDSFKHDRFAEWLSEIGQDTQCDGTETDHLRQEIYGLYPTLSGTMILPDDREDTFCGYDIVDTICTNKGIR